MRKIKILSGLCIGIGLISPMIISSCSATNKPDPGPTPPPVPPQPVDDIVVKSPKTVEFYSKKFEATFDFVLKNPIGDNQLTCVISRQTGACKATVLSTTATDKDVQVTISFVCGEIYNSDLQVDFYLMFNCTTPAGEPVFQKEISDFRGTFIDAKPIPDDLLNIDENNNLLGIRKGVDITSYNELLIPESVITIQPNAFANLPSNIYTLKFIKSDTHQIYIEQGAFKGCSNLVYIQIPSHLAYVDKEAFKDCTSVKTLDFTGWTSEQTANPFDDQAFASFPEDGEVIFDNDNDSTIKYDLYYMLTSIGLNAKWFDITFDHVSDENFEYDVSPDGQEKIITSLLRGKSMPTELVIPKDVTIIGPNAFFNKNWGATLSGLITTEDNSQLRRICNRAFYKNTEGNVTVDFSKVTSDHLVVDDYAFAEASVMHSITFSSEKPVVLGTKSFYDADHVSTIVGKITKVAPCTFEGADGFSSIDLSNVKWIGEKAFYSTNVSNIDLPSVRYIGKSAFENCDKLQSITNLNSVAYVDDFAFNGSKLTSLLLPKTLVYVGQGAFMNTPINEFAIDSENKYYIVKGDALCGIPDATKKDEIIVVAATNKTVQGKPIEQLFNDIDIISIKPYAFAGLTTNHEVLNFSYQKRIKRIYDHAFYGLSSTLVGGFAMKFAGTVSIIDDYAFAQSAINDINLEVMGLVKLSNHMFEKCTHIKEVTVPNDSRLTFIPSYCFSSSVVENLVIPNNILEINDHAFSFCNKLSYIDVSAFESVPNWSGEKSFDNFIINRTLTIKIHDEALKDGWNALFENLGLKVMADMGGKLVWEY